MKCQKILQRMEEIAPKNLAEEWDNPGLLIGNFNCDVKKILVCLDVDCRAIDFAIENEVDLIISHHPIIFRSMKNLRTDLPLGSRIEKLLTHGISVFAAHTNLDSAEGGVNDVLAEKLGLTEVKSLEDSFGRIGKLSEKISARDFAEFVKKVLNADHVRLVESNSKLISKIAVCGGAGAEFIDKAKFHGADLFVTSDVKYHEAQHAFEIGLNVIDAGHFYTEFPIVHVIAEKLRESFESEIEILEDAGSGNFFEIV